MISKTNLIELINNLPQDISIDELIDSLLLIEKVEEAQIQSKKGLKYSEDEGYRKN